MTWRFAVEYIRLPARSVFPQLDLFRQYIASLAQTATALLFPLRSRLVQFPGIPVYCQVPRSASSVVADRPYL